jgi:hypothetical protein
MPDFKLIKPSGSTNIELTLHAVAYSFANENELAKRTNTARSTDTPKATQKQLRCLAHSFLERLSFENARLLY